MKVLTAEQMRHVDHMTIKGGMPGINLMRNAGMAVFRLITGIPFLEPEPNVVVVAGKGNNGGDGFRVAELFALNGYDVEVFLLGKRGDTKGDAATCMNDAIDTGVEIHEVLTENDLDDFEDALDTADVVVDAIFGTGLTGAIRGLPAIAISMINDCCGTIVAVDIPSGVDASTGETPGHTVHADYTVTFGALKVGHVFMPGKAESGNVSVAEIGFSEDVMASVDGKGYTLTMEEAADIFPLRPFDAHKGTAGRIFVIAGSVGLTGAATLVSRAAMRTGAGLVTVGCPASLNDILEIKLTEAMTLPLPEVRKKRCLSLRALGRIREFAGKADVVAIGPGLGTHFETRDLVRRFLSSYEGRVVLDADGINAYGGEAALLRESPADIVITPHPGELAGLMDIPVADIVADPITAAREAVEVTGCMVLLKGAPTILADQSGILWINATGNEGMASGGMGDVLTGIIAGIAAQGPDVKVSAVLGAFLHGLAGDMALIEKGVHGLIADDVIEALTRAILEITSEGF